VFDYYGTLFLRWSEMPKQEPRKKSTLRAAREALGLSVEEVAERVSLSPGTYRRIEAGSGYLCYKTACRLHHILHVSEHHLTNRA
jgi:transcriptional regulator with XRE-family HTH domain